MKKDDKSKSSIKTIVKVPSDHAKLPLWAAVRPKEKRIVRVSGRVIEVGGFDPFEPEKKDVPTLSIAHGRVFYTLMSFRDPFSTANTVTFSLNKFFDRFKRPAGGKNYRDVRRLFRDLSQAYFRITEKNGNRYTYRILKDIGFVEVPKRKESKKAGDTELEQYELWEMKVTFHEEFMDIIQDYEKQANIRVDVLNTLRSSIAQSIYTWLPASAYHHHSEEDAFEIPLATLLDRIGITSGVQYKSHRKHILTRQDPSVMDQLDGAEMLSGLLRCKIVPTTDGKDYKLKCWNEKPKKRLRPPSGKLDRIMLDKGFGEDKLRAMLQSAKPLNNYEIELLEAIGFDISKNRPFLEKCKAYLKESRFDVVLAEEKNRGLEREPTKKSRAHRLNHYLVEAIKNL